MFPSEKLKLKQILSDAILLLCRSALPFDSELSIQALIGVTCDQSDICLLSIEEVINKSAADSHASDELDPSTVRSSQTSSSLCKKSNDDLILTSSSSLAEGSSQNAQHHSRKKKWPGCEKNRETSPVAVCLDSTKSARPRSYDNYEAESAVTSKRQRLEQSVRHPSFQCELDASHSKRRTSVPSCLSSNEVQQSERQKQQQSDSAQAYNLVCERSKISSADHTRLAENTFSSDVIEIKTEPNEEESSVQEEFSEVSFTDQFHDDGIPFSYDEISRAPYQFQTNDRNFNCPRRQRSAVSLPLNGNVGDVDLQLDESMSTLICQHVLKYEGPFVTVRDIQRRRLRQVPANHIKSSMNQLTVDGLGFYKTLCLGIMVFYKCPPSIVDPDVLQRYNVSHEHYVQFYNQKSYMTSSNKHTDNYWDRIITSSPYAEEIVL